MSSGQIIIETRRIGKILRVTAVDVESGTEVVFQVPTSVGTKDLQQLAANKIRYMLNKEK